MTNLNQKALEAAVRAASDRITKYRLSVPADAMEAGIRAYLETLPAPAASTGYNGLVEWQHIAEAAEKERDEHRRMRMNLFNDCATALARAEAAEEELDQYRKQLAAVEAAEEQLGELLSIIHRDGGQYQETHGTEKAVNDAHLIWADLMSKAEEVEAEVARLKAELAEATDIITKIEPALNDQLAAGMEEREGGSARRQERLMQSGDALRLRARSFLNKQKTGEEG